MAGSGIIRQKPGAGFPRAEQAGRAFGASVVEVTRPHRCLYRRFRPFGAVVQGRSRERLSWLRLGLLDLRGVEQKGRLLTPALR